MRENVVNQGFQDVELRTGGMPSRRRARHVRRRRRRRSGARLVSSVAIVSVV